MLDEPLDAGVVTEKLYDERLDPFRISASRIEALFQGREPELPGNAGLVGGDKFGAVGEFVDFPGDVVFEPRVAIPASFENDLGALGCHGSEKAVARDEAERIRAGAESI